jgi:Holliday junction resolvase RusA-like endonuclease
VLDGLQKGQAFDNDRQVVGLEVLSVIGLEDKTVVQLIPLSRD